MASTLTPHPLPREPEMTREDALDAFIAVVNAIEPEHPYYDSPYPVDRADIDFGWTRSVYAKCGPAKGDHTISYSTRMTYINTISRERHLALITHELTHISVPSNYGMSNHPPAFWYQMGQYATQVKEAITNGPLADVFPHADPDRFQNEIVSDPNSSTVDRRFWSVTECSETMRSYLQGQSGAFEDYPTGEDEYEALPEEHKRVTVNWTESRETRTPLVRLPGIGEQTVLKIGAKYDHGEEMVDGLELVESIQKIVSSQYHDDLWYALRARLDRRYIPEEDKKRRIIPSPDRSLYFDDGDRRLPTKSEYRENIEQQHSFMR